MRCISLIAFILCASLAAEQVPNYGGGSGGGTSLPVVDTTAIVKGSADATKQVKLEADGITAGQTRVMHAPDADTKLPIFSYYVTFAGPTQARTITLPDANKTLLATDGNGSALTAIPQFASANVFTSSNQFRYFPTTNVAYTATNKELTSNVATLTIGAHAIPVGATITSAVASPFTGTFQVTAVTGTTVSFARTSGDVASTGASGAVTMVGTTLGANASAGAGTSPADLVVNQSAAAQVALSLRQHPSSSVDPLVITSSNGLGTLTINAGSGGAGTIATTDHLIMQGSSGQMRQRDSSWVFNRPIVHAADGAATTGGDVALQRHAAGVYRISDGSTGVKFFMGGGASVASASALPLPTGNVFHVTGTTAVTSITATNFQAGVEIILIFDGSLTFTHGNNIILAGATNFSATANDTLKLVYDGTNFYEVSRSVN